MRDYKGANIRSFQGCSDDDLTVVIFALKMLATDLGKGGETLGQLDRVLRVLDKANAEESARND